MTTPTQKDSSDAAREQNQRLFRQYLRQADKFIIERQFDEAKVQITEAKKIDANNPFIIAFEERIALFQQKKNPKPPPARQHTVHPEAPKEEPKAPTVTVHVPEHTPATHQMVEEKVRHEVEAEYRAKFTQELCKAEELASKMLLEERAKLEEQRHSVKAHYDEQLALARKQFDEDFKRKVREDVEKAEQALDRQYKSELAILETEVKKRLTEQHEVALRQLEERVRIEEQTLLEQERRSFKEREQKMKEDEDRKLLEALRKSESVFREQSIQQQQLEREEVRTQVEKELRAAHEAEVAQLQKQFETAKTSLQESFHDEQVRLVKEHEAKMQEQIEQMRKRQAEEFEAKRPTQAAEIEAELRKTYKEQLESERGKFEEEFKRKVREEASKAEQALERQYKSELAILETEVKKRLTEQHEVALRQLEERVRKEEQTLLEQERRSFKEREQKLKEESDKKLLEASAKAEAAFREQSAQREQVVRTEIRQQAEKELRAAHEKDVAQLQKQFETAKTSLQVSFHDEQVRLAKDHEKNFQAQMAEARKRQEEEFETKRSDLRTEIESELRKRYEEQLANERKRIQDEGAQTIEEERKKLEAEYKALLQSQNDKVQKVRRELRTEMETVFLNKLQRVAEEYDYKMELLGVKVPETPQERTELYREKMRACYGSGQPSVNEARMLMQLKELLELSFDEHLAIESDVRMNLYVQNVEKRILSGEIKLQKKEGLDSLKRQFGITTEEAARLEPYILSSFERMMTKGRLLVVDDDLLLLQTLEDILTDHGFQVVTAEDISTALEKLQTTAFDFILSDIKFEYDELDGFKLFKAVQEEPQLRSIPFVFMSSLEDGVIVRSGMQLGIDDYLTKPMDPDLLIAVIEGKLKRFRSFQKN